MQSYVDHIDDLSVSNYLIAVIGFVISH